jgi:integrase
MRLMECIRLRVKDIDFAQHQIIIRGGKGNKDRVTVLPDFLDEPLKRQLGFARILHQKDLDEGFGEVYLPFALEKKYRNANKECWWQ